MWPTDHVWTVVQTYQECLHGTNGQVSFCSDLGQGVSGMVRCTHRVHDDCYLFTKSSSCRRTLFYCATSVKLCSIAICMLIDCPLHKFLGSIQKGVRVPYRMCLVHKLQQQVVDVRRCLLVISFITCRHNDICKEVLHYFLDFFFVACTCSP